MTHNEFIAFKTVHALNVALYSSSIDRNEQILFKSIIDTIKLKVDCNKVNAAQRALDYLSLVKESPAITVLKRDLTDLLNKSHF